LFALVLAYVPQHLIDRHAAPFRFARFGFGPGHAKSVARSFDEMITTEVEMIQQSAVAQAGVLFLLALIIAGVLEAVERISNL
jgi:hypothetical protein